MKTTTRRKVQTEDFGAWTDERLIEVAALRLGSAAAKGDDLWQRLPEVILNAPLLDEMERRWASIKDRVQAEATAGYYNRYHRNLG